MSIRTALHIGYGEQPPTVQLHRYPTRPALAAITLDGGRMEIIATNPADLLLIADAASDAARQLSAELDRQAQDVAS